MSALAVRDLPAPDSPMKATHSPGCSVKLTSSTRDPSELVMVRFSTVSAGVVAPACVGIPGVWFGVAVMRGSPGKGLLQWSGKCRDGNNCRSKHKTGEEGDPPPVGELVFPSDIMTPHSGAGGAIPSPRKLSPAAVTIADPNPMIASPRSAEVTGGRTWRTMARTRGTPRVVAASRRGEVRCWWAVTRARRA